MAVVYQHKRNDTDEVFYVGIGSKKYRSIDHNNRTKYWTNIVKKVGFTVEILLEDISWEHACYTEKYLISFYGRRDLDLGPLVNMTDGGEGVIGMKHSAKTREKISLDNKRPEKLAVCMENLKKAQTPEAAAKRRANTDYSFMKDPEFIKRRTANIDHKAISSKIDYSKVAKALSKPILQFTKSGEFVAEFGSAREAFNKCGFSYKDISKVLNNRRPSACGYVWKFKNN